MIGVRDAIKAARDYVVEVYADDKPEDVLLEEVRHEGNSWLITIGFRDPSTDPYGRATPVGSDPETGEDIYDVYVPRERGFVRWPRVYKVVRIDGVTGKPLDMTNRAA